MPHQEKNKETMKQQQKLEEVYSKTKQKNTTMTPEQTHAIQLALNGNSFFLTGVAGTGKSFTIQQIVNEMDAKRGIRADVTALTGTAALQIKGQTIHRWTGLKLARGPVDYLLKTASNQTKRKWKKAECLIIDEISMMSPELFEKYDQFARVVRDNPDELWGGIQLILVGDFAQLPYVTKEKQPTLLFQHPLWQAIETVKLTKVFRQEDPVFYEMLNRLRVGKLTRKDKEVIRNTANNELEKHTEGIVPTRLFCKKIDVEFENQKQLDALPGELREYQSDDNIKNKRHYEFRFPETLQLKEGAQIMFVHNLDYAQHIVNGTRGCILECHDDYLIVKTLNHDSYRVERFTEEVEEYNDRLKRTEVVASRKQFPIKLAWAVTVHKSQGMSLDLVDIDLQGSFASGQGYVALSRARTLQGLRVRNFAYACDTRVCDFYDYSKQSK
jgi:ATP-dependent DNA helicase PIF1